MLLPAKAECRINKLILAVIGFFNFSEGRCWMGEVWDQFRFLETAYLPLPKPSFCPKGDVSVNVSLGEGCIGSFPGT